MAKIVVFTFEIKNTTGFPDDYPWEPVTVRFDTDTKEIDAVLGNGDYAPFFASYYRGVPAANTLVFENNIEGVQYSFFSNERLIIFGEALVFPFVYTNTVISPTPIEDLTVTATHTNETEPNQSDGTINVTASGGTTPYEYSLNNIDWQSDNEFTGLSFGTYVVYVRDSASNLGQVTVTIEPGSFGPQPPIEDYPKELIALEGGQLEQQGAFKRVIVRTVFGTPPATLYNGDFEKYDGQNWERWTKYGGINVARGERFVKDAFGNDVPLQNYTLVFLQRANEGRYIQHDGLNFNKGDQGTLSVSIGKTEAPIEYSGVHYINNTPVPANIRVEYEIRFRIKVGDYYLYNADGGDNFTWVNQLAVVSKFVDNSQSDINSYSLSFKLPEAPQTGKFEVYFYGFMKVKRIWTEYVRLPIGQIEPQYFSEDLTDYTPIEIDDVKLSKSAANYDNEVNSIVNISDNLMNFTKTFDEVEIKFGDWIRNENDLYAVKDQNEDYTTGWIDYGMSDNQSRPLGLTLARYLMKSFQGGYYHFSGDLKLVEDADIFSYNDAYRFDIKYVSSVPTAKELEFENKIFVSLSGEVDYKSDIINGILLRELFTKTPRTNDVTIPSTPTTPLPPVYNDPNFSQESGIFTEQFTEEFQ